MAKIFRRFHELDIWRGTAVLAMLIYHSIYIVDFLGPREMMFPEGGWFLLARFIQWSFLLLVGMSLYLSYQKYEKNRLPLREFYRHQLKRGVIVLCCAFLITLVTTLYVPDWRVHFGVLHFIGTAVIVINPLAKYPLVAGLLAPLSYLMSIVIRQIEWANPVGMMLGFFDPTLKALDYFPFSLWVGVPLLGIFLGWVFFRGYERQFQVTKVTSSSVFLPLQWASQYALLIYLIHVPLIVLAIKMFLS